MNRLFAGYLLVSATALLFPHRPDSWPFLLLVHIGLVLLALRAGPIDGWLRPIESRFPRATRILADWYPLAIMPLLYLELATLNVAVWNGTYFDPLIVRWESALFGAPSQELARAFPYLPLSELLHAAYLSYYIIIYAPPLILYATGRRDAQRTLMFGLMLTFLVHYLFFIFFPVQGPRYLYPPPDGELARGPVYALTHRVLEAGSSRGAAFPSSHVGVTVAQTVLAYRLLPRFAPALTVMTIGLAVGAVYGGFHYATDAIAGFLLGALLVAIAPRLRNALMKSQ
jgi:membrane-associated phospholipid phosphatase